MNMWLDISTYCNAACPMCHRNKNNGLQDQDWLPLVQWDINQFKKAFPLTTLRAINKFEFCGTWGDPIMNKDILSMVEYVTTNSEASVLIHTNGSIRDSSWWWDLGLAGGEQLCVVFAIDGSTQEMHNKYRRKTNLDKILENMHTLSSTEAKARVRTIVFKHNENHIEEITNLAKEYGAYKHSWFSTDRGPFKQGGIFKFLNEYNEDEYLEVSLSQTSGEINFDRV